MNTVKSIVSFSYKLNMHSFEYHISRGEDDLAKYLAKKRWVIKRISLPKMTEFIMEVFKRLSKYGAGCSLPKHPLNVHLCILKSFWHTMLYI